MNGKRIFNDAEENIEVKNLKKTESTEEQVRNEFSSSSSSSSSSSKNSQGIVLKKRKNTKKAMFDLKDKLSPELLCHVAKYIPAMFLCNKTLLELRQFYYCKFHVNIPKPVDAACRICGYRRNYNTKDFGEIIRKYLTGLKPVNQCEKVKVSKMLNRQYALLNRWRNNGIVQSRIDWAQREAEGRKDGKKFITILATDRFTHPDLKNKEKESEE